MCTPTFVHLSIQEHSVTQENILVSAWSGTSITSSIPASTDLLPIPVD